MIAFKFDNCTLIQFYSYFLFYFIFHVYNFHRWWFFLFLCPFSSVHICRYKPNFINWRKVVELPTATVELLFKSLLSQILFSNLKLKVLNIPNLKSGNADKIQPIRVPQMSGFSKCPSPYIYMYVLFYCIDSLAEGPGVARGKKNLNKISIYFSL